jgi:hypothetical protein
MMADAATERIINNVNACFFVIAPDCIGLEPKGLQYLVNLSYSTSRSSSSASTISLSTNPASNPNNAINPALATRSQVNPPYREKLRNNPEQNNSGQTTKKCSLVRSRYALMESKGIIQPFHYLYKRK